MHAYCLGEGVFLASVQLTIFAVLYPCVRRWPPEASGVLYAVDCRRLHWLYRLRTAAAAAAALMCVPAPPTLQVNPFKSELTVSWTYNFGPSEVSTGTWRQSMPLG
jgi:hypothetical protein